MRLLSKSGVNRLFAFLLVPLMAACAPSAASTPPAAAVLTVNYSPVLRPFGAVFQTCTRMQPNLSLLVNELAFSQLNTLPADLLISWGEAGAGERTPYQAGAEELVFIVNRANPVTAISTQQLEAVLSGQTSTWAALLQPACADCAADSPENPLADSPVEIWSYPAGDEPSRAVSSIAGGSQIQPFQSHLAPDPEAMRLAVSRDINAVGFIPRRWLDDSVKLLEVNGLPAGAGQQPILVYASQTPSPAASAFIACLQQVLNP